MATGRRPRRGSTTASLLTGSAGSRPAATPAASALSASSPWSYSPAPESRDVAQIRSRYGLFIDGKERAPSGGEVTITFNPATEEPLAEIAPDWIDPVTGLSISALLQRLRASRPS